MRYAMRLEPLWQPFLWPFGGTPDQSFVEVERDRVLFKFGWGFEETVPRREIVGVETVSYPLWGGIGWRVAVLAKRAAIVGSRRGVVKVTFKAPRRVRMVGLPKQCAELYVSLEEPERFMAEVMDRAGS